MAWLAQQPTTVRSISSCFGYLLQARVCLAAYVVANDRGEEEKRGSLQPSHFLIWEINPKQSTTNNKAPLILVIGPHAALSRWVWLRFGITRGSVTSRFFFCCQGSGPCMQWPIRQRCGRHWKPPPPHLRTWSCMTRWRSRRLGGDRSSSVNRLVVTVVSRFSSS